MPEYPKGYEFLGTIGVLPRIVTEALKLVGTVETPGPANNPKIMGWANEVGVDAIGYRYTADSVPWCGLFMAVVAKRAGKKIPTGPLWALNWGGFGEKALQPSLGDVLTFIRDGGGHVGIYIGEDQTAYHVLGGNQSDAVNIKRIEKKRMRHCRKPPMTTPPASRKPYVLTVSGALSRNEQ